MVVIDKRNIDLPLLRLFQTYKYLAIMKHHDGQIFIRLLTRRDYNKDLEDVKYIE